MGTAENKFKLNMSQIAPVFEKGLPKSLEVGDLLELTCKVSGSPKPTLKWSKDGEPLVPGGDVKITELPNGVVKLSIENMTPEKGGLYTLDAENPNGKKTGHCAVTVERKF